MKMQRAFAVPFMVLFCSSCHGTEKNSLRGASSGGVDLDALSVHDAASAGSKLDKLLSSIESQEFMGSLLAFAGRLEGNSAELEGLVSELTEGGVFRVLEESLEVDGLRGRLKNALSKAEVEEDWDVSEDSVVRVLLYLLVLYNAIVLRKNPDFVPQNPAPFAMLGAVPSAAPASTTLPEPTTAPAP